MDEDLWDLRACLLSVMPADHGLFLGPGKTKEEMKVDTEVSSVFKSVCALKGVEFVFGEKNQAQKAMTVGVKRGWKSNPTVTVDGFKVAYWCYDMQEMIFDEESMSKVGLSRQRLIDMDKEIAKKRLANQHERG